MDTDIDGHLVERFRNALNLLDRQLEAIQLVRGLVTGLHREGGRGHIERPNAHFAPTHTPTNTAAAAADGSSRDDATRHEFPIVP